MVACDSGSDYGGFVMVFMSSHEVLDLKRRESRTREREREEESEILIEKKGEIQLKKKKLIPTCYIYILLIRCYCS